MSLTEEIKRPEGIEAQTYGRNNNTERDWLAQQMAEFERTNKVTVVPIGVSSTFKPITNEETLKKLKEKRDDWNRVQSQRKMHEKGDPDQFFDNSVIRNKTRSKSGYQNLKLNKDGTYSIKIGAIVISKLPLHEALKTRDKQRELQGLPPADY